MTVITVKQLCPLLGSLHKFLSLTVPFKAISQVPKENFNSHAMIKPTTTNAKSC